MAVGKGKLCGIADETMLDIDVSYTANDDVWEFILSVDQRV